MKRIAFAFALVAPMLAAAACRDEAGPVSGAAAASAEPPAGPTNRIDIPPAVRQNLGITFVAVEARRVAETLRVPGRFEYLPTARREYRAMLPGRVELLVEQYQRVDAGTPLCRIESPGWRDIQQRLTDADATISAHSARLESYAALHLAHEHHETQLRRLVDIRRTRVTHLEEVAAAGGGRVDELNEAQGALAAAASGLAEVQEKDAQVTADEAITRGDLAAALLNRTFLLDAAAAFLQMSVAELEAIENDRPRWRTIDRVLIRATEAGVVETLGVTNGAWATEESNVLTVVQPQRLRFHAEGLQSDLGLLRDGLRGRIVAPARTRAPDAIDLTDTMTGTVSFGLSADPDERTVDLYMVPGTLAPWARPGVSAQLEIVTSETVAPVLAIPKAAVQRDGLVPVIFRRDPADANKAIRIEADLGIDDGRWIEVNSGLMRGDEVVLDGAFQLMLATATGGTQQQGGHFHADGTWHAEPHQVRSERLDSA